MITPEYCITYVKKRLGVPFTPFELSDSDLLFWLNYTVDEFSTKLPRRELVLLDTELDFVKTEEKNVFLIPTSSKIITILNVYTTINDLLVSGYPILLMPVKGLGYQAGVYGSEELSIIALRNSLYSFTYEFLPPNKIRITPVMMRTYNIELEVAHSYDLTTIPGEFETIFLKMYLKNICKVLSTIRSTYRTYSTPVADIELNPEQLDTIAQQIEDELKEFFDNMNPGVIVVRG